MLFDLSQYGDFSELGQSDQLVESVEFGELGEQSDQDELIE